MKRRTWNVGDSVTVTLDDGTEVQGQVWSLADRLNYVWVALDSGRFVAVYTPRGTAYTAPSGDVVGKVAA